MTASEATSPSGRSDSADRIRTGGRESTRIHLFDSAKNDAHLVVRDSLQHLLYLFLETEPAVAAFEPTFDGVVEVGYRNGTVLVAALSSCGQARTETIRTKALHARAGRRLVLVPERRLTRWPCRDNRNMVADCGRALLRPTDRLAVVDALSEQGGSATLGEVANLITRSDDPVAAVLSLVSGRVVSLDMERPIDGTTTIRLFDPFASVR